jgi:hypothetical protein
MAARSVFRSPSPERSRGLQVLELVHGSRLLIKDITLPRAGGSAADAAGEGPLRPCGQRRSGLLGSLLTLSLDSVTSFCPRRPRAGGAMIGQLASYHCARLPATAGLAPAGP